MKKHTYKNIQ